MALRLSTRGRYGLRALCHLASVQDSEPVSIHVISKQEDIPIRYLEQIMARLRRESIVESYRGQSGGYRLRKKPSQISLKKILTVLEGRINLVWCTQSGLLDECPHIRSCKTYPFWNALNQGLEKLLDTLTLESVIANDWRAHQIQFQVKPAVEE